MKKECENCNELIKNKYLGKINGKYLCKKCRELNRKQRRKETIKNAGIGEKLKSLDKKIKDTYKKIINTNPPIPKGSKCLIKKSSNCYVTLHERQNLFRILIKRGLNTEEAKERIKVLIDSQTMLRKKLKDKKVSEKEIKIKQQELLEELYNY